MLKHVAEDFTAICADRGPPGAVFAAVARVDQVLCQTGNSGISANLYSSTKSVVGLCIAHAVLYEGFDVSMDVSEYVRVLCPRIERVPDGLTLAEILTHRTGISEINFSEPKKVLEFLVHSQDTHGRLADFVSGIYRDRPFYYSPVLGYMLAGAVYELVRRRADERYSILETCRRLFFPAEIEGQWSWPECSGRALSKHTVAFSELHMTGAGMLRFAQNLLARHRPLLEFILKKKTDGSYTRHARSATASSGSGSDSGKPLAQGGEVLIDYDYSLGWWVLPGSGIVTAIGLGGQYVTIDLRQSVVGVRQQRQILSQQRATHVGAEMLMKRHGLILNSHETFPLLVRDIARGKRVDFDLERKRLFSLADVDVYLQAVEYIEKKTVPRNEIAKAMVERLWKIGPGVSEDEQEERLVDFMIYVAEKTKK